MKEKEIKILKNDLKNIRISLDTIGYETLFMIKDIESGGSASSLQTKDCLIRINNLAQKAHKQIERQESTLHYFYPEE